MPKVLVLSLVALFLSPASHAGYATGGGWVFHGSELAKNFGTDLRLADEMRREDARRAAPAKSRRPRRHQR